MHPESFTTGSSYFGKFYSFETKESSDDANFIVENWGGERK